jgi:hypothetical protein
LLVANLISEGAVHAHDMESAGNLSGNHTASGHDVDCGHIDAIFGSVTCCDSATVCNSSLDLAAEDAGSLRNVEPTDAHRGSGSALWLPSGILAIEPPPPRL